MKTPSLAILGTRGIPNSYGGFEQFATEFSVHAQENGWETTVYCSSLHPDTSEDYCGVKKVFRWDPEHFLGPFGQFVYDLLCILHLRKNPPDYILQLGYTSSALWNTLLPRKSKIITNMDGLEWKRSKYSPHVQKFLKWSERKVVNHSDVLIADHPEIERYLKQEFEHPSIHHISYAATPSTTQTVDDTAFMEQLQPSYDLVIARFVPENSIETIVKAYIANGRRLLMVGNPESSFGKYLQALAQNATHIEWLGTIFDQQKVNVLRHHADIYLHGHTVGGTNPSLLEAMASGCKILAHNNPYNRGVLGENALFFDSEDMLNAALKTPIDWQKACERNTQTLLEKHAPSAIFSAYLSHCMPKHQQEL